MARGVKGQETAGHASERGNKTRGGQNRCCRGSEAGGKLTFKEPSGAVTAGVKHGKGRYGFEKRAQLCGKTSRPCPRAGTGSPRQGKWPAGSSGTPASWPHCAVQDTFWELCAETGDHAC